MNDDGAAETHIQSVRPVQAYDPYSTTLADDDPLKVADDLYTFRVNVSTANAQANPSVGMDALGNFTIAWSNTGQHVSYFNGIYMRQFASDGSPNTAADVMVSPEDTTVRDNPLVVMSADGNTFVMWDCGRHRPLRQALRRNRHRDERSNAHQRSKHLWNCFPRLLAVGLFRRRRQHRHLVYVLRSTCDYNGAVFQQRLPDGMQPGIFGEFARITRQLPARTLRGLSPVNGAPTFPDPIWANDQVNGQVVMDPDGDLTVAYSGFGPDTNNNFATHDGPKHVPAKLAGGLRGGQRRRLERGPDNLADKRIDYLPVRQHHRHRPRQSYATSTAQIDEILLNARNPLPADGYGFTACNSAACGRFWKTSPTWTAATAAPSCIRSRTPTHCCNRAFSTTDQIVNSQRDGNNAQFLISVGEDGHRRHAAQSHQHLPTPLRAWRM